MSVLAVAVAVSVALVRDHVLVGVVRDRELRPADRELRVADRELLRAGLVRAVLVRAPVVRAPAAHLALSLACGEGLSISGSGNESVLS